MVGGEAGQIAAAPVEACVMGTKDGTAPELEFQLETAPFLYAPVTAGQEIGIWKAMQDGRIAAQGTLCAKASVPRQPKPSAAPESQHWWQRLLQKITS